MTQMNFDQCVNLDNEESHGFDELVLSRIETNRLYQLVGEMHRELDGVESLGFQIMSVFERDFVERDGERIFEGHGQRLYLREGGLLLHEEMQCPIGPDMLLNLGEGHVFASTAIFGTSFDLAEVYLFRFVKIGEEPPEEEVEAEDDEADEECEAAA